MSILFLIWILELVTITVFRFWFCISLNFVDVIILWSSVKEKYPLSNAIWQCLQRQSPFKIWDLCGILPSAMLSGLMCAASTKILPLTSHIGTAHKWLYFFLILIDQAASLTRLVPCANLVSVLKISTSGIYNSSCSEITLTSGAVKISSVICSSTLCPWVMVSKISRTEFLKGEISTSGLSLMPCQYGSWSHI